MKSVFQALASLLLTAVAFAADPPPMAHVGNFGLVNEHLLRGAEPSAVGIEELGAAGVKAIIDLREPGQATEFEKQLAKKLGIEYVNVPFPPFSAPSKEQMQTVLGMLAEHASDRVFIHCRRGKDRTGTVVACYRIEHDGWDNQRALQEARQYGMSYAERGMRSFILHFTAPIPAQPKIF